MEGDNFSKQLIDFDQRIKSLREIIKTKPMESLEEALEEMQSAFEELQVAEEELRLQQEELQATTYNLETERLRYKELFDFAPDGYMVTNVSLIIREANQAASTLLKTPLDHLIGKPLGIYIAQEDRRSFRARLGPSDKEIRNWELRLKPRESPPFYANINMVERRDSDNNLSGFRWLFRDVTEQKALEKQLKGLSSKLLTAQEDERSRIASDIHDSFGASFAFVKIRLESFLEHLRKDGDNQFIEPLEEVVEIVKHDMEEVRRMQMALRPPMLDDLGIIATLEWFCREFQTSYPEIRVTKAIHLQEKEVPDLLKVVIYRTVQEAMNNAAKHSKSSTVRVSLRKTDNRIELAVRDDGFGFDPKSTSSLPDRSRPRLGIVSIKERCELLGGSFSIASGKDEGTTVRAGWHLAGSYPIGKEKNLPSR